MGWLHCDPDNIFKDHVYTTAAAAKVIAGIALESCMCAVSLPRL